MDVTRLTGRVFDVLALANLIADRYRHPYIGNEHILVGLMRQADKPVERLLLGLGTSPAEVQSLVERHLMPPERPTPALRQLNPRATAVLTLAYGEADRLEHTYIGPEHLLLGSIVHQGGISGMVFETLGISPAMARAEAARVMNASVEARNPRMDAES